MRVNWAKTSSSDSRRAMSSVRTRPFFTAYSKKGLTHDDIDLFFFHQANLRINQYVADQLGIPHEKLVSNIQRYGNTTAATIPIMLAEASASGRLKRGMKIAMVAFGSGFTWGSAVVDW